MADTRRSRSRGLRPRATTGPGRGSAGRAPGPRPSPAAGGEPRGPRFTGRAAILVLVLAVLAVSYASSLRAWLQQRDHLGDLRAQIAETNEDIDALEREKRRWRDDAYVERQARQRFGYVMPGETGYLVIDEDGEALDSPDRLSEPDTVVAQDPTPWWETAWGSVEAAGLPEQALEDQPADTIRAPAR